MNEEVWMPVAGYEGLYDVSNLGNVRSLERCTIEKSKYGKQRVVHHKPRTLRAGRTKRGYLVVVLCGKDKQVPFAVHRLVATAFVEKPSGCNVQIAMTKIAKPADVLEIGQIVDAKIVGIDNEKQKVNLSIRALLEEAKAELEAAPAEDAE